MIRKCYIYHCDICGSEQMFEQNICRRDSDVENGGWSAFSIVPASRWSSLADEYSLICPNCKKKIELGIENMRKDAVIRNGT